MSIQLSDLVKIAGITILGTALWAASVAFTYWDAHRRGQVGGPALAWVAAVALLPFLGFLAYLAFRAFRRVAPPGRGGVSPVARRETALKPPPPGEGALPTMLAAEAALQTPAGQGPLTPVAPHPAEPAPAYRLAVTGEADPDREILLGCLPARIGRGPEAAIRLDADLGVSRLHAELYARDGGLWIRDLNSAHGTRVNGMPVEEHRLDPGDRIQIGRTVLLVERPSR